MSDPIIEFRNLGLSFDNKKVFENKNIKIFKGEKVLIKGPSGSGKSTLLKLLLGYEIPEEGKVLYKGEPLDASTAWEARKKIAYVPQKLLLSGEPVSHIISLPFSLKVNSAHKPDEKEIEKWLRFFNLEKEILEKTGDQLSGGEAQRIAMVTAILLKRECYLLDEATSALDGELKEKAARFFLSGDETVVALSHDPVWEDFPSLRTIHI